MIFTFIKKQHITYLNKLSFLFRLKYNPIIYVILDKRINESLKNLIEPLFKKYFMQLIIRN